MILVPFVIYMIPTTAGQVQVTVEAPLNIGRRTGSTKTNDSRVGKANRNTLEFHGSYPPYRVDVDGNGKLSMVIGDHEEQEGPPKKKVKNETMVISVFHFLAYFDKRSGATHSAETQAACDATAAVNASMEAAMEELQLGKNSGSSYWSKINNLQKFESWCIK